MKCFYWDSSAWVKRYTSELGSQWVASRFTLSALHFAIEIGSVEIISALARRARENKLNFEALDRAHQQVERDIVQDFVLLEVSSKTLSLAKILLKRHILRAYDSVQLASALLLAERLRAEGLSLTFICADKALLKAATSEALPCDDPSLYPAVL